MELQNLIERISTGRDERENNPDRSNSKYKCRRAEKHMAGWEQGK